MKRIIILVLLTFILWGLNLYAESKYSGTTSALFLTIPPDAKSSALGEAGVALCNDVSAIFWNPAGLVQVRRFEIMFSYASHLEFFNYNFLATAITVKKVGTFGLAFNYIGTDDFLKYIGREQTDGYNKYSDMAFSLSYARIFGKYIAIGINSKLISQILASDKAELSFAFDAGILITGDIITKKLKNLILGVVVKNLGPALKIGSESDRLPFQVSTGVLYTFKFGKMFKLRSLIDVNFPNYYSINVGIGIEAEISFAKVIKIYPRVGFKLPYDAGILSGLTMGIGLKLSNYNIDFAFSNYADLKNIYKFSLILKL